MSGRSRQAAPESKQGSQGLLPLQRPIRCQVGCENGEWWVMLHGMTPALARGLAESFRKVIKQLRVEP